MYTSFFGLTEKPFAITPDPRYLYLSERHAEALAHLLYGINESGGFIQLTGEVGTGKTTVVRTLLSRVPHHADVAVTRLARMNEEGRGARARQRGGDLAADVPRFAHAGHHDSATAVQTIFSVMGTSARQLLTVPGNRYVFGFIQRQYSRRVSSSFGVNRTSRSRPPLPRRT